MSVRVSSPGAAKASRPNKASQARSEFTGVAAARGEQHHPQSTNVSSPVSKAANRRKGKNPYIDDEAEDDEEEEEESDNYGFEDGFIVPDDHVSTDDDEDDDFEPVRQGNRPALFQRSKRDVGPRITSDVLMTEANVSDLHKHVINNFIIEAKKLDEEIRNSRGIRKPIFTETQLREMCIHWMLELKDIRSIEGVNQEQVEKFGFRFVALIRRFHTEYDAMMRHNEDRDIDQNHRNVIDLVSDNDDDEFNDNDDDEEADEEEVSQGETSQWFQNRQINSATQAFNQRLAATMPPPEEAEEVSYGEPIRPAMTQAPTRGRGGKARGGSRKPYARRASGGSTGGAAKAPRARAGGSRKRSSGAGSGAAAPRAGAAPKAPSRGLPVERRGGSTATVMSNFVQRDGGGGSWQRSGQGGGGLPGIGMMPTR